MPWELGKFLCPVAHILASAVPLSRLGPFTPTAVASIEVPYGPLRRPLVVQRTDGNTPKVEGRVIMRREVFLSGQPPRHAAGADKGPHVPLEVFYVVRTTGGVVGKRHHRICPPLYETPHQAHMELIHLRGAAPTGGIYSVWKSTAYAEPAEWLYDVVIADGSIIHAAGLAGSSPHERRLD